MATPFRDFIPENEDTGAQGRGFRDFVPEGESAPVVPATTAAATESVYAEMSAKELKAIAKEKGIDVKGMKKEEIVKALEAADAVLPETPAEAEPGVANEAESPTE